MRNLLPPDRLATRLFAAQALVVAVGAVTLSLVAIAVAPGLLRDDVSHMMDSMSGQMSRDLDQALAATLSLSLVIAVGAALLASLAISWFITRRLTAPVTQMAAVAGRIAGGDYAARVPASRLGVEFAALDSAFNQMAATLQDTERRRREMLADLAHELRTPIATVDSFLEGIEDGVIPAGGGTWRTLRKQTSRLRRLVDDIDSVSRVEERRLDLRRQPVRLDDAIDDVLRAVAVVFADKGVTLEHRRHREPVTVQADPDRLREILDNLLSNALRHTPPGGTVTVTTTRRPHDVDVTVADTGEGIAAEHLDHVFERFYRADPSRSRHGGGSGIGLTIARALAQTHGGSLHAASGGAGHGATFTLTMPTSRRPDKSRSLDQPDAGQSRTG
jgi:two-component system sensor histidine kinase BaeS